MISLVEAQNAFREFARSVGLDMGETPTFHVGRPHRFDVYVDGKKKSKRAYYGFYFDGICPAGFIGDWGTGECHNWKWGGETERLSREEWQKMRSEMREKEKERKKEADAKMRLAQKAARDAWGKLQPAPVNHLYLKNKGVQPHNLRYLASKNALCVPMFDQRGQVVSFQAIYENGRKQFFTGAGKKGFYNYIGTDYRTATRIYICEGFSTGATIAEAITDAAVIIAFDAGNIEPVARFFASMCRAAQITICGDNDRHLDENVGAKKAEAAAAAIGGNFVIPIFPDSDTKSTDFNDIRNLDEVRRQILGLPVKGNVIDIATGKQSEKNKNNEDMIWTRDLEHDDKQMLIKKSFVNFRLLLTHKTNKSIRYNVFNDRIMISNAPWSKREKEHVLNDDDTALAREWLQRKPHYLQPTKTETIDALRLAAKYNSFDPIVDYLNGLKWDGIERINNLFGDYFGSQETEWTHLIAPKFLISAVARAIQPGCKVDTMVVLEGDQGAKKSSALQVLFGRDYARSSTSALQDEKKLIEIATGSWVFEIAEFAQITRPQFRDKITAMITTQTDFARLAYATNGTSHERRFIFVGSINPTDNGYLTDPTGNRRYWPIKCGEEIDLEGLRTNRDQLWAEAVHRYKLGERWWLEGTENDIARTETAARFEIDPWEEILSPKLDAYTFITTSEVYSLLDLPKSSDKIKGNRVGAVMRKLGYKLASNRMGDKFVKGWKLIKSPNLFD